MFGFFEVVVMVINDTTPTFSDLLYIQSDLISHINLKWVRLTENAGTNCCRRYFYTNHRHLQLISINRLIFFFLNNNFKRS